MSASMIPNAHCVSSVYTSPSGRWISRGKRCSLYPNSNPNIHSNTIYNTSFNNDTAQNRRGENKGKTETNIKNGKRSNISIHIFFLSHFHHRSSQNRITKIKLEIDPGKKKNRKKWGKQRGQGKYTERKSIPPRRFPHRREWGRGRDSEFKGSSDCISQSVSTE